MSETARPVRLRVWHRHGPDACGGVAFICRHRFTSEGKIIQPEDFEWPSGRQMAAGDVMVCDSCARPVGGEDMVHDMQEAGAYPTLSLEVGERVYDTYSGALEDDLAFADDDSAVG